MGLVLEGRPGRYLSFQMLAFRQTSCRSVCNTQGQRESRHRQQQTWIQAVVWKVCKIQIQKTIINMMTARQSWHFLN